MIELRVTLDPSSGQVTVTGPLNDKLACLAMLDEAREQIHALSRKPVTVKPSLEIAGPAMRIPNLRANGQ